MKTLIFSDLHYHLKNMDVAHRCLETIEDIAIQTKVDRIFCLGDFWHEKSMMRSEVLRKVFSFFKQSRFHWHILVGNHDLETTLDTAGNALDILNEIDCITVVDKPIDVGNCHFIPFCRSADDFIGYAKAAQKNKVLLIHQGIEGAAYSSGVAHVSEIKLSDLAEFKLVISGHIHAPQEFDNLVYVGSPFSHTFSEAGERKSVIILDGTKWDRVYLDGLPKHITVDVEVKNAADLKKQLKKQKIAPTEADHVRVLVRGRKEVLDQIEKSDLPGFENMVLQKSEATEKKQGAIDETITYDAMVSKYIESIETEIPKDELNKLSQEIIGECNAAI